MRTLHGVWTLLAVAGACALLTGCGTAARRVDASPFLLGDPSSAGTIDAGAFAPAVEEAPREQVVPPQAEMRAVISGATIESADPRLAAALLVESVAPTADNHVRVAREYLRLGILDAAHGRFTQALDRDPRMAAAHEGVARLWRDWGLLDRALGSAHRAVFFDASSASALNTLGTVLDALGQSDDALAAYSRAHDSEPGAGWALTNLCSLSVRLGRLDEARRQCAAALELSPTLLRAHNNLALTYAAIGDLESAGAVFTAAGDPAGAAYNLGILHLSVGDFEAAADAFEAAIAARPDFTKAKARAHAARVRTLQRTGAAGDK